MRKPPDGIPLDVFRAAEAELGKARQKWSQELEPKIAAKLARRPGLWALYQLIRRTKAYEGTQHHDTEKAEKAAGSKEMIQLLELLVSFERMDATAVWQSILQIEQQCGKQFNLLDHHRDGLSGMSHRFAAALGITVGTAPQLEDFLPATTPRKRGGK